MQDYTELDVTKHLNVSIPAMQTSLDSVASLFSGTAFPTQNLFVGMPCVRTDQKMLYICTAIDDSGTATWSGVLSLKLGAGKAETDGEGNNITATYLKKEDAANTYLKIDAAKGSYITSVTVNGAKVTVTGGDGSVSTFTVDDVSAAKTAAKAKQDINGKTLTEYVAGVTGADATVTVTDGAGNSSSFTVDKVENATNATNAENATNATNATNAKEAKNSTTTNGLYFRKNGNYLQVSTDGETWKNVYYPAGPWGTNTNCTNCTNCSDNCNCSNCSNNTD